MQEIIKVEDVLSNNVVHGPFLRIETRNARVRHPETISYGRRHQVQQRGNSQTSVALAN